MISVIEAFSDIIESYEIKRYRQYDDAHEFVVTFQFADTTELHVRDYIFLNQERKYSFHWQTQNQELIKRWDNSPHHQQIETFPAHVHTPEGVEKSKAMTLQKVLEYIKNTTQ